MNFPGISDGGAFDIHRRAFNSRSMRGAIPNGFLRAKL
jgi:hypothetical protein